MLEDRAGSELAKPKFEPRAGGLQSPPLSPVRLPLSDNEYATSEAAAVGRCDMLCAKWPTAWPGDPLRCWALEGQACVPASRLPAAPLLWSMQSTAQARIYEWNPIQVSNKNESKVEGIPLINKSYIF